MQGEDFVAGRTYCRLGELSDRVFAEVADRKHLTCKVGEKALGNDKDSVNSTSPTLFVSNDGGQRWVSGLFSALGAVRWFNNSLTTPITVFSVYSEVHVGAVIFEDGSPSAVDRKDGLLKGAALAERDGSFGPKTKVTVHFINSTGDGAVAVANVSALLKEYPDLVGIAGPWWSSTSIPVAFNISLPRQLPMISYGAFSSVLGDKKALPYFLRTSPSSVNEANEMINLFNVFRWKRIGIISSTDSYSLDAGDRVRDRFTPIRDPGSGDVTTTKTGEVLYKGMFAELARGADAATINAAASSHKADGLATHARRLKELGATIM